MNFLTPHPWRQIHIILSLLLSPFLRIIRRLFRCIPRLRHDHFYTSYHQHQSSANTVPPCFMQSCLQCAVQWRTLQSLHSVLWSESCLWRPSPSLPDPAWIVVGSLLSIKLWKGIDQIDPGPNLGRTGVAYFLLAGIYIIYIVRSVSLAA
jgi:hypothetical protein